MKFQIQPDHPVMIEIDNGTGDPGRRGVVVGTPTPDAPKNKRGPAATPTRRSTVPDAAPLAAAPAQRQSNAGKGSPLPALLNGTPLIGHCRRINLNFGFSSNVVTRPFLRPVGEPFVKQEMFVVGLNLLLDGQHLIGG